MKHPHRQLLQRIRNESADAIVLIASRRRCCLCFALANDATRKMGQLAHIDRDRTKSTAANLAFLCLDHHEEYDSKPSTTKRLTPRELLKYKSELEEAVANGSIPSQSNTVTNGLRWALIEIAEESAWYEIERVDEEEYSYFSWSWTGATGEGDEPTDKLTDPVFDVTLQNAGTTPVIISRIGAIAERAYTQLAGFSPPVRIMPSDFLSLNFQWLPKRPQWIRLHDPVGLEPQGVFRFKLQLKDFANQVPGNRGIIRLCCQTDTGSRESDGICLAA